MLIGVRNRIVAGSPIELILPNETVIIDTRILMDDNGQSRTEAHNDQRIYLPVEKEAPVGAILRQNAK